VSRNSIQRIGYIAFIQSSAVDIFIVVHQKFARLNAACGKAHNCNIVILDGGNSAFQIAAGGFCAAGVAGRKADSKYCHEKQCSPFFSS
jgi:hypothetical protein